MPNWCENDLWIHGPKVFRDELLAFVASGEDSPFDFNNIVPQPEIYHMFGSPPLGQLELDLSATAQALFGYLDWYSWCGANWGTKWNARHTIVQQHKTSIKFKFSTAWGPPEPVIDALAAKYPALTITHKYYECGMQYQGRAIYRGGIAAEKWNGKYSGSRGG